jgi:hypothetical protein
MLLDSAAEILFMGFCFYEDNKNYDPLSKLTAPNNNTKKLKAFLAFMMT